MVKAHQLLGFTLGVIAASSAIAQVSDDEARSSDAVTTNYVGDNYRIGIGYDTETDLTGEFSFSFGETATSAWIGEGWLGARGAGGAKLNYHWLGDGVQAGLGEDGQPVYSDGKVRKLFLAADRNQYDDAKVSFGFGSERNDRFWSLYGSKSITGERFIGQDISIQEQLVTGVIDNHAFSRTDSFQTLTEYFAHPYDWGAGFRVGRYFDEHLVRLRGGLDYELGDNSASQLTLFAGLDKRFADSPYGVSLRAEALRKSGDFEIDKNDLRVTALFTWDFGTTFRPASAYRNVEVQRLPEAPAASTAEVKEVIQNRVSLDNASSFALDSSSLRDAALASLHEIVANLSSAQLIGGVKIIGHTCYLGSNEYNQALSERRAKAVYDQLLAQGLDASQLQWEGEGEQNPLYSNDTEESRKRNRRVELQFTTEEEVVRTVAVGESEPVTEWVQEAVPQEAAWIRRALRNPVVHKRSVDYYRTNRVTESLTTGDTVVANTGPTALDDAYSVAQDSADTAFAVLLNDSDPEGDDLTIVTISGAAHGTAVISGDQVIYTPASGYFGSDSFSYTIEDGYGGSATATVRVTVVRTSNDPPVAVDDFAVTGKNQAVIIDVLANDSDPNGDPLTIVEIIQTVNKMGTVTINGDGTVTYDPMPGWWGGDSFQYRISDGRDGTALATVIMDVRP